jgi:hypothetical protein
MGVKKKKLEEGRQMQEWADRDRWRLQCKGHPTSVATTSGRKSNDRRVDKNA